MPVVVVESPAKAKTINKYLGDDYVVLASYGHVRDLPAKDGSVRPDDDFAMTYQTDPDSTKHLRSIAKALRQDRCLILATDPDREGEAISWHVLEALRDDPKLGEIDVSRVVFNEITRNAVREAMRHPRALDMDLVNAQQARRALDYLVGFTLSPVLWRKLPGARSAGRVQSVALRLVVERELEIEAFDAREYWSITADFGSQHGPVPARLTHLAGRKLEKFSITREAEATAAVESLRDGAYRVLAVETRPNQRRPQPPFTTSTLQQEAARKLRFAARRTMQTAQRLYEGIDLGGETVGLITYMRTDGVQMAAEAIEACRAVARADFGAAFVPADARVYKTRAKNAQEAHEAIRPTDPARRPADVARFLDDDQRRLYELVWKRALASQMANARLQRTTIDIEDAGARGRFRATGTVVEFPGFLKLYEEGRDDRQDGAEDDDERRLPPLAKDEAVSLDRIAPNQHFTEPPPRFTEATLVKRLEDLGIGRPSTYASILSVLQDRAYVRLDKARFWPEDKGLLVTSFLASYFARYVEYDFTADLEAELDDVSAGKAEWKALLRRFWDEFCRAVDGTSELRVRDVLDAVNEMLAPHLYAGGGSERTCPSCGKGSLSLRSGRHGAFLGCSDYPECRYTRPLKGGNDNEAGIEAAADGPIELGGDPETGDPISLRRGPYGLYIQRGEAVEGEKPKRASLPADVPPEGLDLTMALALLGLPREVGPHPDDGKPIESGIGRYGPFLRHDGSYARLASTEEVLTIGLNRAVALIAEAREKGPRRNAATVLRELGPHPEDGETVTILDGRYGPYVKHKRTNASLPKDAEPDGLSMEQAVALLDARKSRGRKTPKRKTATPKKTNGKKTGGKKKPAARKRTPKPADDDGGAAAAD